MSDTTPVGTVDVGEPCAPGIPGVPACPDHYDQAADLTVGAVAGLTLTVAVLLTVACARLLGGRHG